MATTVDKVFGALGNDVDSEGKVSTGTGATWSAGVAFKRAAAIPLEKYSLFKDYASAVKYASLNSVAYPGQIIVVLQKEIRDATTDEVTTPASTTPYVIKQDGTLAKIAPDIDLTPYATTAAMEAADSALQTAINSKASQSSVDQLISILQGLTPEKMAEIIEAAENIDNKADKSTTYTKTEVDEIAGDKEDAGVAAGLIGALNLTDDGQGGIVVQVTQTAGQLAVTKRALVDADIPGYSDLKTTVAGKQDALNFTSTPTASNKVVTEDTLADAVADLAGAMHFKGVFSTLPAVASYEAGDVVIVDSKEYVLCENDSTKTWEELGDQNAYVGKDTYNTKMSELDQSIEDIEDKLDDIEDGAQVNVIEHITVNGTESTVTNKTVALGALAGKNEVAKSDLATALASELNAKAEASDLTSHAAAIATSDALGHVKSSTTVNNISVNASTGVMSVNTITTDKLVDGSEEFIIDGGSSVA